MKHVKSIFGTIVIILSSAFLLPVAGQNATSQIPEELIQQLIKDINTNKTGFHLADKDFELLHQNLKYELHDLNGDSKPEFFLYIDRSDWRGAGGYCSYWIYQKTDGGYRLLLKETEVRVLRSATKGYKDLVSRRTVGFCAAGVQRVWASYYKYDGQDYHFFLCGDGCIPIKK